MTKVRTKVKQKEIKRKLTHIPAEEKAEILAELSQDTEQEVKEVAEGRVPGREVNGQKTTWTYRDWCERFPIVSFVPDDTIPITLNGVRVQLLEGVEIHVPEPFHQVYRQWKTSLRRKPELPNLGFINEVQIGLGALPPRETE